MIEKYTSCSIVTYKSDYKYNGVKYVFEWDIKQQGYKVSGGNALPLISDNGSSYLNINVRKISKARAILREYLSS